MQRLISYIAGVPHTPISLSRRLADPVQPKDERDILILELAGELMMARDQASALQAKLFESRYAGWFVANFRSQAIPHVRAILERLDTALTRAR